MIVEKKKTLHKWIIHFLKESLTMAACVIFLFSVFFPFYHLIRSDLIFIPGRGVPPHIYYWSFKVQYISFSYGGHVSANEEYWFYEQGFYGYYLDPRVSSVLLLIFAAQVFTLGTGIASIFVKKKIVSFASVVLCLEVALLMVFMNFVLSNINLVLDSYKAGYWLTYLSMLLFLLSFILKMVLDRKKGKTLETIRQLEQSL